MSERRMFREAVGEVAQQAAALEAVVAVLTWGLVGVEQEVGRVALPNSVDSMLRLCTQLLPSRVADERLRSEVSDWIGNVRATYGRRSRVIHSVWIGSGSDEPHWRADVRPLRNAPDLDAQDHETAASLLLLAQRLEVLATTEAAFLSGLARSVPGPWSVA